MIVKFRTTMEELRFLMLGFTVDLPVSSQFCNVHIFQVVPVANFILIAKVKQKSESNLGGHFFFAK